MKISEEDLHDSSVEVGQRRGQRPQTRNALREATLLRCESEVSFPEVDMSVLAALIAAGQASRVSAIGSIQWTIPLFSFAGLCPMKRTHCPAATLIRNLNVAPDQVIS